MIVVNIINDCYQKKLPLKTAFTPINNCLKFIENYLWGQF